VSACPSCGHENPDGARFCNTCGTPLKTDARALGEERKTVTVVFVDLVGFTAQAERLDPEDVRSVLTPYHARVRAELERHGGTVEKYIGDAVMAVFGAPAAHEDDPERAVRAALSIRDGFAEQAGMQLRIAVHTGEALVALGARPAEGEAMVAGDVVNTAARMQGAAPVNGVLVGETTFRATRDAISYRDRPPMEAKGKAEPVPVWEAVEAVARLGVDVAEGATTPLAGRDHELDLLRSLLGRVRDERSAQLVTLVGVPGIGKSRLVGELFRIVDGDPELIRWRQGRCLPYGERVTYWALGEIVKAEAGILETDSAVEAGQKLDEAVTRLVPETSEARWLRDELGALVGLAGDRRHAEATTATTAWRRFFDEIAERGPTVLVFEDLHWADDGLLDFLEDLVDWLRGVPLLVVGTARPELLERRQRWGGGKANATTISLQPLGDADAARLISALLSQPVQLAYHQQALLARAGGNPLFAEQFVRMLTERGTTGDMPESVQGVIAARLDALSRAEKDLLQDAAVQGKVFWLGGIAAAMGLSEDEAERLLRSLVRKDFVRRERRSTVAGDSQYSFQHVLLRDVAYGQIPRAARASKHRQAAEWIEGLGRPEDHAELLAHHYGQALELSRAAGLEDDVGLVDDARASLTAAGKRAMALRAHQSAGSFFADALALTPPGHPERPRLLLRHARALLVVGTAGFDLLPEAIESFRAEGDVEGEAEAATVAARFAWFTGDRPASDRYIEVALDAVRDRPKSPGRAAALTNKSGFLMLAVRYEEAIEVGSEALPIVEALGMEEERARLHIVIGTARWGLGNAAGLDQIRFGITVAEAAGDVDMTGIGLDNLLCGYFCLGQLAAARELFEQEKAHGERYGLTRLLGFVRLEDATWKYLDGRWDEAMAGLDAAVASSNADHPHYIEPQVLSARAWIRLARGDAAGADRDSGQALALARSSDSQAQSATYCVRAMVDIAVGRPDEANELVTALAAIGPGMAGALNTPLPTLADVAWAFRDLGRAGELVEVVLGPDPIGGPWNEAARAICDGDLVRVATVLDGMGHTAAAAYAHLRAAEARGNEGARERATAFYGAAGAAAFLRRLDAVARATAS
jgi:class 3 adenylate cyclase/tetratricopeptide (TPR) repeat protein